jgi:hypothetical protein
MKRKAYRINKAGSINNLKLVDENLSEPKENEVQRSKGYRIELLLICLLFRIYSATRKKALYLA